MASRSGWPFCLRSTAIPAETAVDGFSLCFPRSENPDLHPSDEDLSLGPRTWGTQLWITAGDWVRAFPPKRSLEGAPMFVRMDALIKKARGFPHGGETHLSG